MIFCYTVMTNKPVHTASKERMVPGTNFASQHVHHLLLLKRKDHHCLQPWSAHYTTLNIKKHKRHTSINNRVIKYWQFILHIIGNAWFSEWRQLKWDIHEGKSKMHVLYVLQYAKRHQMRSDIRKWKIKSLALPIYEQSFNN